MTTLRRLPVGKSAEILSVGGSGALRQHLLDMGLIPGTVVTVEKYAPMGDPLELKLHGYELTLRKADAGEIKIKAVSQTADAEKTPAFAVVTEHPGLGEGGRFHDEKTAHALPDGTVLTFALVGNQNCGKTTLFNRLTGARQHVGNFPGVTVTRKSGAILGKADTQITDLPGIYSLSPYSGEEIVTRNFVFDEKPKAIINIVDATNIERNLYLTMQLMELDVPMVVALNMMDEVRNNGGSVDINALERLLGVPVVPVSAISDEGVGELVAHAVHIAKYGEKPLRQDFCGKDDAGGALHRCLHAIVHMIEDHAQKADIPVRFAASKLIEGDALILEKLALDDDEKAIVEGLICQMEKERGLDRAAAMADMCFSFIKKICSQTVKFPKHSKEYERSRQIDRVLTGKYTAVPVFIALMAAVFWLTFEMIGPFFQEKLEVLIDRITQDADALLTSAHLNQTLHLLIIDGVFAGVGTVLSFLPIIVTLFFFLSLMEDSGYIARVAFFMDKLLRKIGLSGRSIVPMLIGFGCTVPAVMATRTLPSERDRKMTVLLTPFMSCTAKLPIYAFFIAAFFPENGAFVMTSLYLTGVVTGVLAAFLMKKTLFRGKAVPFVMELPNYRLPGVRNVALLLWEKSKDFLQKAFTVIFVATVVVWFLQTFDARLHVVTDSKDSLLALLSGVVAPLFAPLGMNDWRLTSALITGVMAKESVVSTLTVLFGDVPLNTVMTPVTAVTILVFCLLYVPCVAAVAAIKRELGVRWTALAVVWQCAVAWAAAFAVRLILTSAGVL